MKKTFIILFVCLAAFSAAAQTISATDFEQSVLCSNFDCFRKLPMEHGITMEETPYKDAIGGKHQIFFNPNYEEANIEVYSVGITFRNDSTMVFVKSKNTDFMKNLFVEVKLWGDFKLTRERYDTDDGTYSDFASEKIPGYYLKQGAYFDEEDGVNYITILLIRVGAAEKLTAPAGGTFSLVSVASLIQNKDLQGIKNLSSALGISGYSEKTKSEKNLATGQDEEATFYSSFEYVCNGFPLFITAFKGGDMEILYVMTEEQLAAAKKEMAAAGYKPESSGGLFGVWSKGVNKIMMPLENSLGGECSVYCDHQ